MKYYHVVSHTHWDREWYQTFEEFRHRLVDLIDRLLDIYREYPDYVFHLDAQTICLEDYLEIRPGRRTEIEKHVKAGRLIIGPWYVQNDFFLTSGEATVRNLLIGSVLAKEFGTCDKIGYTPDQFGLISQLPQIFCGFGIDCCIFGRGYQQYRYDENGKLEPLPQPNEFDWSAPDGSRIFASFLNCWYNNAQRFSADPERAFRFFQKTSEAQDDSAVTPHRLLMNGVDHLEAQEDLLPILKSIATRLESCDTIRQSTLRSYVDGARDCIRERKLQLKTVCGELREGTSGNILQGTLSTWTPLKRENVRAQAMLEHRLEPLYAMLGLLTDDESIYDLEYFRHFWKSLLKNHPHDSICGCSRDRVHNDNMNRYTSLRDSTDDMLKRGVNKLLARLNRDGMDSKDYLLAIFNPLPCPYSGVIPAKLYLPLEEKIESFRIIDPSGEDTKFTVTDACRRYLAIFPPINLPGKTACNEMDILLEVKNLPPLGYRVYTIKPHQGNLLQIPSTAPVREAKEAIMENDFLRVSIGSDGDIDLFDKVSLQNFPGVITFTDESDIGHSYNFLPEPNPDILELPSLGTVKVESLPGSELRQAVRVVYRVELPLNYDFRHRVRCAETVSTNLTVVYTLDRFARRLNLDFTLENFATEHRIRIVFRTAIITDESLASSPFAFINRNRHQAHNGIKHNGDQPNSGIVNVSDGIRSLTVFNEGLFEYEHLADGKLALTLLRSIRRITNNDYPNQEEFLAEAYEWEAPGTGLTGTHCFRAALFPGLATPADLETEYRAFLSPPYCGFDSVDVRKFTSGRPCDQDTTVKELFFRILPQESRRLTLEASCLRLSGNGVLSAMKRAEDGHGYIIRIYNPSKIAEVIVLTLPQGVSELSAVELDEYRTANEINWSGGPLQLILSPFKIITLRLQMT